MGRVWVQLWAWVVAVFNAGKPPVYAMYDDWPKYQTDAYSVLIPLVPVMHDCSEEEWN